MLRYYTAVIFLSIVAMVGVQLCVYQSATLSRERKRLFHVLFTAIAVAAFCEWFGSYLQGSGPQTRVLHIVVKAVELSVAPSISVWVAWIIERQKERAVCFCLAVHTVLEMASGVWGFIYTVDGYSNYAHARWYGIYIAAYLVSMVYCCAIMLRNVKKYQYHGGSYFLVIVGLMLTGIGIQLYDSELQVVYVTLAMASVMLYVFVLEMVYQTDGLTELVNRRGYENYIAHREKACGILFFDVDHFKQMNDTYGHAFGDAVLSTVGQTIRAQYARYGKCFRFGGDEFCVILERNLEKVEVLNRRFFEALAREREKEARLPFVSIGYALYDPHRDDIRDVVAEADRMMYRYKEQHRGEWK